MKTTPFVQNALGVLSLLIQIFLIAITAWFLPTRLTTRKYGFLIYIFGVPAIWICFSVLAMLADGVTGNDVPGVGYLVEGLISGLIGFLIYGSRLSRKKSA